MGAGFPRFHDFREQAHVFKSRFIGSTQGSADSSATDPVTGAFVRDSETPTAGANYMPIGIAPVGDRSRSRNYDHARTVAEGGFQGNHHIANHFDFSANKFRNDPANRIIDLRPRGSSQAYIG